MLPFVKSHEINMLQLRSALVKQNYLVNTIIILIALFYIWTNVGGHNWGDDFSMYITHANNIAHGRAYTDSLYIYNPNYPELGPKSYPPVFPLMLAPIIIIFGIKLAYLKL